MRGLSLPVAATIWVVMSLTPASASASSVLLVGDSNIRGALGIVLERDLEAMGHQVTRYGVASSGLARPDFFDWSLTAKGLAEMVSPDIVLVMFGANDTQRIKMADGRTIHWRDEGPWLTAYTERWRALAKALRGEDRRVIIFGPTNRRSADHVAALQRVIGVQRAVAKEFSGVTWLDLFPHSTDARGRHLREGFDVFGRRVRYRMSDGRHLTRRGGVEVARRLLVTFDQMGIFTSQLPAN